MSVLGATNRRVLITISRQAMCVDVIKHNNSTTSYTLTVSEPQVGWMAIGFGRSMIRAQMVILWRDTTNGNTIISQRSASDFIAPTVISSPNPVATALPYLANVNSSAASLSFVVPSTTETRQDLIWAWSKQQPDSNSPDANIVQHDDEGSLSINLANPLPDSIDGPAGSQTTSGANPATTSTLPSSYGNSDSYALTPSQKIFVAHGVFLTLAFMVILPLGALQARLLRTFVPGKWWFTAHWILQWPVTTVLIVIGFALGVSEVNKRGSGQLNSPHKKWGLVLVLLYIVQCSLGGVIHFFKPKKATKRPPQNYTHAVIGLLIIALSFWQVHTGLEDEWAGMGGEVPTSIWTWWKVWIVLLCVLYFGGLALLRRQYDMEATQRAQSRTPSRSISGPKLQQGFLV
ncbi:hypothetical protein CPB86DRAFT_707983 [Serendipita vermifera]|nr:hypothetical protein CPB86DRAFT_707983 [Serendipita vermifera]